MTQLLEKAIAQIKQLSQTEQDIIAKLILGELEQEDISELGKSERRAIYSQLIRLMLHLLKWQYQPHRRSDSWLDSITDARTQIELTIKDSPSLKNYPQEQLEETYQKARYQAAKQTKLIITIFPEECPYSLELVLDEDWLPE